MTRINCIPVTELCDQHLIAEYKEMLRFRSTVPRWLNAKKPAKIPAKYKMGTGHVTFFNNKLPWLQLRHYRLRQEMQRRGFETNFVLSFVGLPEFLNNNWHPNENDMRVNRIRIIERLVGMVRDGKMPRWTNTEPPEYFRSYENV